MEVNMKTIKIAEEYYSSLKAINKSRKSIGLNQSFQETINSIMEHIIEMEIESMSEEELESYHNEKTRLDRKTGKEIQRLTDVIRKGLQN